MSQKQKEYRDLADLRYMTAHEALWRNSAAEHEAGIDYETPEYHRLNRDVWAAEDGVPWWRQWLIDRRILRELDYWRRIGER
jgi:hypothetical protein